MKSIKRGVKLYLLNKPKTILKLKISSQNNNNYATVPTSPNPYISRKLNNMKEARLLKKERNDWMKLYYKILQGLEAIIDIITNKILTGCDT